VGAILEATKRRHCFDVRERRRHAGIDLPKLKLAHAGRVQHETPVRQQNELAMRGGVASTRIILTDRLGGHQRGAAEGIDEARFANAGTAQQDGRLPDRETLADRRQPLSGDDRDRVNGDAKRDRLIEAFRKARERVDCTLVLVGNEERFSAGRMAREYVRIYEELAAPPLLNESATSMIPDQKKDEPAISRT